MAYYSASTSNAAPSSSGGAGVAAIEFPRTVCRSASSVLGMIHWQWRTIEVASGVMNAWPPKEERKREVLTFRGAKVTSITPLSDPKAYAKLMKNAADAAAKRPSTVAPITQPAFVRLELPPGSSTTSSSSDKDKDKGKTREVYIVVPDDELQGWLRVFTGAQDAQRYSLLPEDPALAATVPTTAPSPAQSHLRTAPGAMMHAAKPPMSTPTPAADAAAGSSHSRGSQGSTHSSGDGTAAATRGAHVGSGGAGRGTAAGSAQRPLSMGVAPAPQPLVQRTASATAPGGARPMSLALGSAPVSGAALPPDPNRMLVTVLEPDAWAIGTQQPALSLDDPDDGPVIISGAAASAGAPAQDAASSAAWQEYFDEDGVPYYHNDLTNETTWERPHDFHDASAPVPLPLPAMPTLPPMPALAHHQHPHQHPQHQQHPQQHFSRGGAYTAAPRGGGGMYGAPPRGGGGGAQRGAHVGRGGALPAYPQGAVQGGALAGDATMMEAQVGLSAHDAVDVLAALDEFADMHFGLGTLPAHMHSAATPGTGTEGGAEAAAGGGGGGGSVASPFGSQTLADLDELNNPEFF